AVLLGIIGGMLAGAAFLRRQAAQRERADLYFEDGSMLSLTNGSPGADRLLPLAREILGKTRGTCPTRSSSSPYASTPISQATCCCALGSAPATTWTSTGSRLRPT